MSQSPSQFDVSSFNGAQQCDCWRHHSSSRVCVRSVACLGFCRFHQCKKPGSRSIWSCILLPGKIPFLDCLVTRDNNKLKTTIYKKPTHTDQLLDQSSYNPTSNKVTTIGTLTRRAQLVCDSPYSLQDETDCLNNVFSKNNYNTDFVRRNTHSNTDSNTHTNSGPYIRGTSETITRILQPYNIGVAHKPITTSRRLLTNVKDKDRTVRRQYTRSNAATARPLTSVKPVETLACNWPNTNERQQMVTSTITLLSTIYRRKIELTGALRHV